MSGNTNPNSIGNGTPVLYGTPSEQMKETGIFFLQQTEWNVTNDVGKEILAASIKHRYIDKIVFASIFGGTDLSGINMTINGGGDFYDRNLYDSPSFSLDTFANADGLKSELSTLVLGQTYVKSAPLGGSFAILSPNDAIYAELSAVSVGLNDRILVLVFGCFLDVEI